MRELIGLAADYIVENSRERERMNLLLDALTDDDLLLRLDSGLTVAGVLIHLAFWDDYCADLVRQWVRTGPITSRSNFDAVNASIGHLASVIPIASARDLARSSAASVDAEVEGLSADLASEIAGAGSELFIRRSVHRGLHLDQIEAATGKGRG